MAQSILSEYTELLKRKSGYEKELSRLPKGYISKKTIGNKEYCYLQFRSGGKIASRYLQRDKVSEVRTLLERRKEAESALRGIDKRLDEIEAAARLLDTSLLRRLHMLKLSAGMDDICREERESCISFADAMTSIEGVPVTSKAQSDLDAWKNGSASFVSVFEQTLIRYGFAEENSYA